MSGYYIQDEPASGSVIQLSIDTLEKIGREVMTGFGKVPRRGAEVGGILLGTVVAGDRPVIRIEEFAPVAIQYRFGPSYLLSEADEQAMATAISDTATFGLTVVGFVRSNTREGDTLTAEDVRLTEKHFPGRPFAFLLVRPFATRPGVARFFTCIEGEFRVDTPAGPQFPFRRRDLVGAIAPVPEAEADNEIAATALDRSIAVVEPAFAAQDRVFEKPDSRRESPTTWLWFPLSFVFLLIGILLGFEASGTWRNTPPPPNPWDLKLGVSKSGSNLAVRWDHNSAAVRSAQRGSLTIYDGTQQRTVDLGGTELTSGTVVYAPSSGQVRFRLEVFPNDSSSVSQTVDWNQ